ncbi:fumarylacetoacetate hydrolase family protein [Gemmatimonas sp.]|jgi:2-keto-4-pentenoate hydratase/2-oxohepta-3-ene-1,7-dioic acid hydratase in catechol pathway|uniref:fumarylacetoacetate hydrolase family protein n=1 Tax=Gemmatimonas sp. TaxID=1962908 RepID=UPI0022C9F8D4|nr:fumarylacetoacetate hydrolase family protein [Gemmatimonas sp.]MCZ8205284.1 fumarylacetoacetate hydrolase family protein [Gemmatimonas sp.]
MSFDRRDFLKSAGAIGALAAAGCAPGPSTTPARTLGTGLARGLTLLSFRDGTLDRLGAKTAKGILDVARAAELLRLYAPSTLDDLLQQEDGPSVQAVVEAALTTPAAAPAFRPEEGLVYGPLVRRPDKIVCVGLNYRRHAEEVGAAIPAHPVLFNKFNASLNNHGGTVTLPVDLATQYDYEVELVIVIGRTAKRVSEAEALSHVAGYATGNDFTARDLQNGRGGQWMVGKALDGFAPIGPYLVTADQVDPDNLTIECRVNGETRQSSSTSDFIFGTRQMVSYISQYFTLKPGDLIFTGTPAGVIQGMAPERRQWLKPGDAVACSVQGLGELAFTLT